MGIKEQIFREGTKKLRGRALVGIGAAAAGGAYVLGGLNGAWKNEEGEKRGLLGSIGASVGSLAKTTAVGLGLAAGVGFASNLMTKVAPQMAAGAFKAGDLLAAVPGAARMTYGQVSSQFKQFSRVFKDPVATETLSQAGLKNIAAHPELASKWQRAGHVAKTVGGKAESLVEHTADWLGANWIPNLKLQGNAGDIVGAYGMAAAGVYTGYEGLKSAYEGDLGGAVKAGAIFAAEKYAFMAWKKRGQIMNFAKNAKKADWISLGAGSVASVGLARNALFEGISGSAAFIKTGAPVKDYLSVRANILGSEGIKIAETQLDEILKNTNLMTKEHLQKLSNRPGFKEGLNNLISKSEEITTEAKKAHSSFINMSREELAAKDAAQREQIEKGMDTIASKTLLGAKAAKKRAATDMTDTAVKAQEIARTGSETWKKIRESGADLRTSEELNKTIAASRKKFAEVPVLDEALTRIEGLRKGNAAAPMRDNLTDFASPYQGPKASVPIQKAMYERVTRSLRKARRLYPADLRAKHIEAVNSLAWEGMASAVGAGFKGANLVSKVATGATLAQVGFMTAAVAGVGLGIGAAMDLTPEQTLEKVQGFKQSLAEMNKPTYGSSQLGQSTQGLVFGLNNRRRG